MVLSALDLVASFPVQRQQFCLLGVPSIVFHTTFSPTRANVLPTFLLYLLYLSPCTVNSATECEFSGFRTAVFWNFKYILLVSTFSPSRCLHSSSCINCSLHQIIALFVVVVVVVVIYTLIDEEQNEFSYPVTSAGRISHGLVHDCPS